MKLRPFELGLVVFFLIVFVVGLVIINNFEPDSSTAKGEVQIGRVQIWGTLPAAPVNSFFSALTKNDKNYSNVSYRYIPPGDFGTVLINALADQQYPDLILIPHTDLVQYRSRIQTLPYTSFPARDFQNLYIDGASIFALSDGIAAFPLMVDPLMMYWNKDILSDNGFLAEPATWEELVSTYAPALTEKDYSFSIKRSTIAMGSYDNITNVLPIISTLLLQGGSGLIKENNGKYQNNLDVAASGSSKPFLNAVNFFTSFSNINNSLYSWSRTQDNDKEAFLKEDLVFYFGFGSEARELASKNPNLSFDIAEIPQGEGAKNKRTFGHFYGLARLKVSKNPTGALAIMQTLGSESTAKVLADGYNMAPVYRASLTRGSNDIYGRIIYKSALNTRGWLSPSQEKLGEVFRAALEDVGANRKDTSRATAEMTSRIGNLY